MKVFFARGSWASTRLEHGGMVDYPGNASHAFVEVDRDVGHRWIARVRRWKVSFHVSYLETSTTSPVYGWQMERDIVLLSQSALANEQQVIAPPTDFAGSYVGSLVLQTSPLADPINTPPAQARLDFVANCALSGISYLYRQDGKPMAAVRVLFGVGIQRTFVQGGLDQEDVQTLYNSYGTEPVDGSPYPLGTVDTQLTPMIETIAASTVYGTRNEGLQANGSSRSCQVSNLKLESIQFWSYGGTYDESTGQPV